MRGGGGGQRPGQGLEHGLEDVVAVLAVQQVDVQGQAGVQHQGAEEFLGQAGVEGADPGLGQGHVIMEMGPVGKVGAHPGQGLVHGHVGMAVAADARLVAQGPGKGHAQADAQVLDGVVVVDLGVAGGGDLQVEQPVDREQGEHVVHEADAGAHRRPALAVQVEADADVGLPGAPFNGGLAAGLVCHVGCSLRAFGPGWRLVGDHRRTGPAGPGRPQES